MKYIIKLILAFAVMLSMYACSQNEVPGYEGGHSLFFERWKMLSSSTRTRIDTVRYSFSHFVGKNELTHYFRMGLIGDTLAADTEYKIVVVDSLTTASPEQYALPEHPMFHKGSAVDSLPIIIKKVPSLKDKEVVLTVRLVENENFDLGYWGYRDVKIRFNDKIEQPLWWDLEVEAAYLGVYSYEKLEAVMAANPGFTSYEGLSGTARRKVALNTKQYIAENGITEKDGSTMLIPIY